MGMFDGAIDTAMAKAQPMFDELVKEFEGIHGALTADTAQDAQTQATNAALMQAVQANTAQIKALRATILATAKLAAAHPAK